MAAELETNLFLALPTSVVGPADVARLERELEDVNDFLHQASLRQQAHKVEELPRTSRLLEELATANKLNLLLAEHRQQLSRYLRAIDTNAPVITISFASDPSPTFTNKIVDWLRSNIHPHLLVRIGLQPTLAAGCVVRTATHVYDLSLRNHLEHQQPNLVKLIHGAEGATK